MINKILSNIWFWYIFFALFVLYNLFTLPISPLPWFDEVIFLNITDNFYKHGRFLFDIYPWRWTDGEVFSYGPIYFWLTSLSWKCFGVGIFQFRLINFVFGILSGLIILKITQLYINKITVLGFLGTLIFLDPVFIQNTHSGRMDLIAFFFILLSLYLILSVEQVNIKIIVLSAIFAVLALLTTPRVFFLEIALGFAFLLKLYNQNDCVVKKGFVWGLVIFSIYSLWIFYAFGNYLNFFTYYTTNSIMTSHFGGNWNVTSFQYPLIFAIISTIIFGLFRTKHVFKEPLIVFCITALILFYSLIYDYGLYNAMVLPLGYLFLFLVYGEIKKNSFKIVRKVVVFTLLFINIGIFTFKNLVILSSKDSRSLDYASEIINKSIPSKSSVVIDDRYSYAMILNNNTYQSFEEGNIYRDNIEDIVQFHKNNYEFNYFIISNESMNSNPSILMHYEKNYQLTRLKEIKYTSTSNWFNKIIDDITTTLLGHKIHGSYEGTIYKAKLK